MLREGDSRTNIPFESCRLKCATVQTADKKSLSIFKLFCTNACMGANSFCSSTKGTPSPIAAPIASDCELSGQSKMVAPRRMAPSADRTLTAAYAIAPLVARRQSETRAGSPAIDDADQASAVRRLTLASSESQALLTALAYCANALMIAAGAGALFARRRISACLVNDHLLPRHWRWSRRRQRTLSGPFNHLRTQTATGCVRLPELSLPWPASRRPDAHYPRRRIPLFRSHCIQSSSTSTNGRVLVARSK